MVLASLPAKRPRKLVTIHIRQTDIEQANVRRERCVACQGRSGPVFDMDFMSCCLQQQAQGRGRIQVVGQNRPVEYSMQKSAADW